MSAERLARIASVLDDADLEMIATNDVFWDEVASVESLGMQPVYDAEWIEKGMHVTNLGRREMPDTVTDKFDVVVRQGTAGLQMRETERFQAERGLSPAAFIAGTPAEMARIPAKNLQPGLGGQWLAGDGPPGLNERVFATTMWDPDGAGPLPRYTPRTIDSVDGLLEELCFPDCSFDAVTLFDVIEHVGEPLPLMRECHRILKPGGV